eukprot:TCALIF_00305-PA protein Name:"Similar to GTSF1 Gametocyte-specific factor 1 (Macaca fascicularis)" AED:0.75 eAED:0.75 QI:0/0/0/1/0/0/2/0/292
MMGLKTVTCPYNESHQILPHRIQYHIIKCAKNHPEMDMAICPYNATHHIPRSQELLHLQDCPDRDAIELQKFRVNDLIPGPHGQLNKPVVYGSSLIPFEGEVRHSSRPTGDWRGFEGQFDHEDDDSFDLDPEDREVRDIIDEKHATSKFSPPTSHPPPALDETQDSIGFRGMGRGTRLKRRLNQSQATLSKSETKSQTGLPSHQIGIAASGQSSVLGRGMSCLKSYQQQRHRDLVMNKVREKHHHLGKDESFEDAAEEFKDSKSRHSQSGLEMSLENLMIHDQNMARLASRH